MVLGRRRGTLPEYIRRCFRWSQMDVEYTLWQMLYLCFAPRKVYRHALWHKQTKNQWARDDPGFVAILTVCVAVCAFAYGLAFHVGTPIQLLEHVLWAVFVDFFLVGAAIATVTWTITNRFMRLRHGLHDHTVEQHVEWLYAFDIHCNAFWPTFLIIGVVQLILLPVVTSEAFVSVLLANTLYLIGLTFYFYLTFLGYNALPFVINASYFLLPVAFLILVYLISVASDVNIALFALNLYFPSHRISKQ